MLQEKDTGCALPVEQNKTASVFGGLNKMHWDYITHRIRRVHRSRFVVEQPDRHGEWEVIGAASTIERAERLVEALKRPKPRRLRHAVDDTAGQDNLPRGSASTPYMMPSSDRGG